MNEPVQRRPAVPHSVFTSQRIDSYCCSFVTFTLRFDDSRPSSVCCLLRLPNVETLSVIHESMHTCVRPISPLRFVVPASPTLMDCRREFAAAGHVTCLHLNLNEHEPCMPIQSNSSVRNSNIAIVALCVCCTRKDALMPFREFCIKT